MHDSEKCSVNNERLNFQLVSTDAIMLKGNVSGKSKI